MDKKTILIVDDEEGIRDMLERFCQHYGYKSILCENAGQAIHRIADADLVITDFEMPPGMNGVQLAKIIKTEKNGTPVILITGKPWGVPEDNPADVIIPKPFQSEGLQKTIETFLSQSF